MREKFPKKYDWKRYWYPLGSTPPIDENGFLHEPSSKDELDYFGTKVLKVLEDLKEYPCLILLGEPGIGKSTTLKDEYDTQEPVIEQRGDLCLHVDLAHKSMEMAINEIIGSNKWQSFLKGNQRLELFIDSLDECMAENPSIAGLLGEKLSTAPKDRLFLRLACRAVKWPSSLGDVFNDIWDEKAIKKYMLAPLTMKDVSHAATEGGLDPDEFIKELISKRAGHMASVPNLLVFIINLSVKGQLPNLRYKLFEEGLRYLSDELNRMRKEKEEFSSSIDARFTVAARIAATLTFARRSSVYTGVKYDKPDNSVLISDLLGGEENADKDKSRVTPSLLKETLDTAMFKSYGDGQVSFVQQTYVEFLTAWYLKDKPMAQIKSLLAAELDNREILSPLFSEVVTWLSCFRDDVFSWVLEGRPEILLQSDALEGNDNLKHDLVNAVFERIHSGRIYDSSEITKNSYNLCHPGIAKQILPVISDKARPIQLRRYAIKLASECQCIELADKLAGIALDNTDNTHIRSRAAGVICDLPNIDSIKDTLEPLLHEVSGDEEDNNELLVAAILALWLRKLTTLEVLKVLKPEKENFVGSYQMFLWYKFLPELKNTLNEIHVIEALDVISAWPYQPHTYRQRGLTNIADEVVRKAWSCLPDDKIINKLAHLFVVRNDNHTALTKYDDNEWMYREQDKVLMLLDAVIKTDLHDSSNSKDKAISVLSFLIVLSSYSRLLDCLESALSEHRSHWAHIVFNTIGYGVLGPQQSKFWKLYYEHLELSNKYMLYWEFESEPAITMKKSHERHLKYQARSQEKKVIPRYSESDIRKNVIACLDKFDSTGEFNEWHQAIRYLSVRREDGYVSIPDIRLSDLLNWNLLDKSAQSRVMRGAKVVVENHTPETNIWFKERAVNSTHTAEFAALLTLFEQGIIDDIPVSKLRDWIPFMIGFLFIRNDELYCGLFELARRVDDTLTKDYFIKLIDLEIDHHGSPLFLSHLRYCLPVDYCKLALGKAKVQNLPVEPFIYLLDFIKDKLPIKAQKVCLTSISGKDATGPEERKHIVACQAFLFTNWCEEYWTDLKKLCTEDKELAIDILLSWAYRNEGLEGLVDNENIAAEVYLTIKALFPDSDDPKNGGYVTERHKIAEVKRWIPNALASKGTRASIEAVEHIIENIPEVDRSWMKYQLQQAENSYLNQSTVIIEPVTFIEMMQSDEKRMISSNRGLHDVTIESLMRMQEYCVGDLAGYERLWNTQKKGKKKQPKPKEENEISNEVKRWFKQEFDERKVIVNREVEIRPGSEVDLFVETGKYKVVVETKGCWHVDLLYAMKEQLVERYLLQNNISHGIYLVPYCMCDKWVDCSSRKQSRKNAKSVVELQLDLNKQAACLMDNYPNLTITPLVLEFPYE